MEPTPLSRPAASEGLTTAQVAELRAQNGWNELPAGKQVSALMVLLRQFRGLLVLILIAAAGIAVVLGEVIDAIAIGLVVVLNGALGFVQEWRAETAIQALKSMLQPSALVVRDGKEQIIPAREIVPGDLVIVEAGDAVPADLKLVTAIELRVDESVLTGESVPVDKSATGDDAAQKLLMGTTVVAGRAEGLTTAIGRATAFGKIADLTGSVGEKTTQLQVQLGRLAQQLGLAAVLIAAAIAALGIAVGRPLFEMVMTGLSLAVAIVPEGLPAVVTITLALGASAMVRRKALARRLQAVETLGAASVICTDKTGTLTENRMTATEIWTPSATYTATGNGYDPTGHIEREGHRVRATDDPALSRLLQTGITCTHAQLYKEGDEWVMTGAPTEGALVALAYKGWCPLPMTDGALAEVPFSSERKRMSMVAQTPDGPMLFMKGAPEAVLAACDQLLTSDGAMLLDVDRRAEISATYAGMAQRGLRVIALASREAKGADDTREEGLVFLGLVGIIDPPRPEVKAAIAGARSAGIRVIMITGDGPVTAQAIANQLGMGKAQLVEGKDLDALSDDDLRTLVRGDVLFARTRPEHKMRIVEALQANGKVVAMTGDGVNDAPALKRADIGVAMGIRGTDVSKSAADLVLLDDNFATIVNAIAEGRRQFDNVRKFVRYLLSSNAGEVIAILANLLIGGPLIFLATQILWMNLVTDSVTAVALGLEKGEKNQMERPPRKKNERILGPRGLAIIVTFGLYTGAASLWLFYSLMPLGVDVARTVAFTGMVVFEKVSVFAFRSLTNPCWKIGWFSNPLLVGAFSATLCLQAAAVYWEPMQLLLRTVPIGLEHWGLIALLAAPLVILPEVVKTVRSGRAGKRAEQGSSGT